MFCDTDLYELYFSFQILAIIVEINNWKIKPGNKNKKQTRIKSQRIYYKKTKFGLEFSCSLPSSFQHTIFFLRILAISLPLCCVTFLFLKNMIPQTGPYSKVCHIFLGGSVVFVLAISKVEDLDQDLSYDESLSGRPGAWLVKFFFICMQSQNFKKNLILKFKTISRTFFL